MQSPSRPRVYSKPAIGLALCALWMTILLPRAHAAQPGTLFSLERQGDRVARVAVVAPGASAPDPGGPTGSSYAAASVPRSPMLDSLADVYAVLEPRDLAKLTRAITTKGIGPDRVPEPRPAFDVVLSGSTSDKRIRVWEGSDGLLFAKAVPGPLDEAASAPVESDIEIDTRGAVSLEREALFEFAEDRGWTWQQYRGDFSGFPEHPLGTVFALPPPYEPGRFTVDKKLLSDRLLGGRPATIRRSDRILNAEKMWVRLPAAYSPRNPSGVVVWIDAMDDGKPPGAMFPALDELNLMVISLDNTGNQRHLSDRLQLAFDALATARVRFHTDPSRTYVAGLSGGGRVAGILQGCFPDVFTGCIGVVGMSHFELVHLHGNRGTSPNFAKPTGKMWGLLRSRRIATISGERDPGYITLDSMTQMQSAAGLQARFFQYPDMGHTLPTPARFREALRWIDESAARENADRAAAADRALDPLRERVKGGKPLTPSMRGDLAKLTAQYPWTPAAWEACEMLGAIAPSAPAEEVD